jgi:hypothetical protein
MIHVFPFPASFVALPKRGDTLQKIILQKNIASSIGEKAFSRRVALDDPNKKIASDSRNFQRKNTRMKHLCNP